MDVFEFLVDCMEIMFLIVRVGWCDFFIRLRKIRLLGILG